MIGAIFLQRIVPTFSTISALIDEFTRETRTEQQYFLWPEVCATLIVFQRGKVSSG